MVLTQVSPSCHSIILPFLKELQSEEGKINDLAYCPHFRRYPGERKGKKGFFKPKEGIRPAWEVYALVQKIALAGEEKDATLNVKGKTLGTPWEKECRLLEKRGRGAEKGGGGWRFLRARRELRNGQQRTFEPPGSGGEGGKDFH